MYAGHLEAWQQKINAQILSSTQFQELKQKENFFIVGVMGFAGSWRHTGYTGRTLDKLIDDAQMLLQTEIIDFRDIYQNKLVVCSGATNKGVLHLTYKICNKFNIIAMGVTPNQALQYDVGRMHYLIPYGQKFGDESEIFVDLSDAFVLLGGGFQARQETILGTNQGKPVTVIQGFGGVADQFSHIELPKAKFIQRSPIS